MRNDGAKATDGFNQRVRQRDEAIARVSRITTATAVAGTMATIGFGGLAAVTYSGSLTNADTTSITSDDQSADGQVLTQPGGNAESAQATPAPTLSTSRSGTATTVRPPTTTRTRTHVSSGGS